MSLIGNRNAVECNDLQLIWLLPAKLHSTWNISIETFLKISTSCNSNKSPSVPHISLSNNSYSFSPSSSSPTLFLLTLHFCGNRFPTHTQNHMCNLASSVACGAAAAFAVPSSSSLFRSSSSWSLHFARLRSLAFSFVRPQLRGSVCLCVSLVSTCYHRLIVLGRQAKAAVLHMLQSMLLFVSFFFLPVSNLTISFSCPSKVVCFGET